MNIRFFLLGAGAALTVTSQAYAVDAIVAAEPEPLEYVRICDGYGTKYFQIPGTATCLKLAGRVRTEGYWKDAYNPASRVGTLWHTRAEFGFDTATDTEYGPLKTNTVIRFDWNDGGVTTTKLLWANISLGGFVVGKADSQYNNFIGYAGDVINDDVIFDGPYELNQLTYKYDSGHGFAGVISLEDSNSGYDSTTYGGAWHQAESAHYMPNAVIGLGFKSDALSFKTVAGYDSIEKEGAIKARVDANLGTVSVFLMGGWNTDGDKLNRYAGAKQQVAACTTSDGVIHGADCGWGDWAVWGGVGVPINEKLKWNLQLAYSDSKIFEAATNIKFNPVKDLLVEPELTYVHYDLINAETVAGLLRFERRF